MPFVQYSMQLPISSNLSINLRQWHALDILSSNNPVLNHPEIFPILSVKKKTDTLKVSVYRSAFHYWNRIR